MFDSVIDVGPCFVAVLVLDFVSVLFCCLDLDVLLVEDELAAAIAFV